MSSPDNPTPARRSPEATREGGESFEILVDACSLAYTTAFTCSGYRCRCVEPERDERIKHWGRGHPVCPWSHTHDEFVVHNCSMQHLDRAKLLDSLL